MADQGQPPAAVQPPVAAGGASPQVPPVILDPLVLGDVIIQDNNNTLTEITIRQILH